MRTSERPHPTDAGRLSLSVLVGLCAAIGVAPLAAQPCDPEVGKRATGTTSPYDTVSATLCEGTYRAPVSSGIYLQSVFWTYDSLDLKRSRDPIVIDWVPSGEEQLRIRADAKILNEYYRLDASASDGPGHFIWDTETLRALAQGVVDDVGRSELAIRGWVQTSGIDTLFVPIRVSQRSDSGAEPTPSCESIRFAVWTTRQPRSVSIATWRYDVNDTSLSTVLDSTLTRPNRRRRYPITGQFEIRTQPPELTEPGLHRVIMTADLGDSAPVDEFFVLVPEGFRVGCP